MSRRSHKRKPARKQAHQGPEGQRPSGAGPRIRPNPRRQLVLVAVALVALGLGYLAGHGWKGPEPAPRKISAPMPGNGETEAAPVDKAIFPDPAEVPGQGPLRAYEEPLPREIHSVSLPLPPPPPEPLPAPPAAPLLPVEKGEALPTPPPPLPTLKVEVEVSPPPASAAAPPPARKGLPAWRQHAAVAPETSGRPMIAVVIDDMGLDRRRTGRIAALRAPLTLSFLTYAEDLPRQTAAAREQGHELLLHVPMEPAVPAMDPGPKVLATRHSAVEIQERLAWGLSRFEGFVGINNHMGSKFTADRRAMNLVMQELRRRGLLFLDSRTVGHTAGPEAALRAGVPFAERNVFLDNVNDVGEVRARLADLEAVAARHGYAIGIGHPRDATIAALTEWTRHLGERGFVLVPLTAIVSRLQTPG